MKKQPSARVPMYSQIRDYIFEQIKQDRWNPGDKLPSENELSAQFDVSRITIKKALSDLIEQGLIFRVQGKGSFVSNDSRGEPILFHMDPSSKEKELQLIAFLMPRLENVHTAQLLNGIESEASRHGYKLLFCKTHDSQEQEKQILREMVQIGVKGIIIFPVDGETYNEEILRMTISNFPLVVIDRYLRGIETNCIYSNNFEGAYEAVSHLINHGHKKIGLVSAGAQGTTSIEDRISGYERALADHHIPIEHRLRLTHFDVDKMNEILTEETPNLEYRNELKQYLLQNPDMTAVFGMNSSVGLTVMDSAFQLGIPIPEKLSVVFYDNDSTPLAAVTPTCISQGEKQLGHEAVKLLLSVVKNPQQEKKKIVMPARLIVRGSTGPCSEQDSII